MEKEGWIFFENICPYAQSHCTDEAREFQLNLPHATKAVKRHSNTVHSQILLSCFKEKKQERLGPEIGG